ncbi:MAG: transporter, partial [Elusimicrobia bacterium]|nr:transporter [Elusimicrobiota bacterium]
TLLWIFSASTALARVNGLEPWSPGVDFEFSRTAWTREAFLRTGSGADDFLEGDLAVRYVPNPRWELEGKAGYIALDRLQPPENASGVNDFAFGAKYNLTPKSGRRSAKLIGEAGLTLPTGNSRRGLGSGGWGFSGGLGLRYPVQAMHAYSYLGADLFSKGNKTHMGNIFRYVFGTEYPLRKKFSVTMDVRGALHGKDKIQGVRSKNAVQEIYFAPGAFWQPKKNLWRLQSTLLIGLSDESYDVGWMGGAQF